MQIGMPHQEALTRWPEHLLVLLLYMAPDAVPLNQRPAAAAAVGLEKHDTLGQSHRYASYGSLALVAIASWCASSACCTRCHNRKAAASSSQRRPATKRSKDQTTTATATLASQNKLHQLKRCQHGQQLSAAVDHATIFWKELFLHLKPIIDRDVKVLSYHVIMIVCSVMCS